MGIILYVNGLFDKYFFVLINGKKVVGDILGFIDYDWINMDVVKCIEVLKGVFFVFYGSDVIVGVINIIIDDFKFVLNVFFNICVSFYG